MNSLKMMAIVAGLSFGAWPIFMNKSGLNGFISAAVFAGAASICIIPFALYENGFAIPKANWTMVAIAVFIGALGLIMFNGMLAKSPALNIGNLIIITTLMQVVMAASYQIYMSGQITLDKICGYALATAGAYILLR
jgi:drug/metabolite transporter (DMT)-like permease